MLFSLSFGEDNPLFCVAFHPSQPQFIVGLADGTVSGYTYGTAPTQVWTTRRHDGSCRAVAYTEDGKLAATAGSEGVVKLFDASTGRVKKKTRFAKKAGATALCINEEYIVVGDDAGAVTVYTHDLAVHRRYALPDIDSVACIRPLYCFNKHNFAVGCDTFVARIDARKDEPVVLSEDQEDEVLCGCVPSDTYSCFGMSEGVVTVWKNQGLTDQQQRIKLTKDGSVDALLAGEDTNTAWAALSTGEVALVDVAAGRLLYKVRHAADDCLCLDYDHEYRLVSGSMTLLKVWDAGEPEEEAARAAQEDAGSTATKRPRTAKKGAKKSKKGGSENEMFADLL